MASALKANQFLGTNQLSCNPGFKLTENNKHVCNGLQLSATVLTVWKSLDSVQLS